jgi:hypothetical protein
MKLYQKKLGGLEDLQHEKVKLLYQKRHLDKLHEGNETDRDHRRPGEAGILNSILSLAGGGNSAFNAVDIGSLLLKQLGKKRRKRREMAYEAAEFPKQKSTARKIVDDIFWSYVVGKAVRVSTGILKDSLKKKKIRLHK